MTDWQQIFLSVTGLLVSGLYAAMIVLTVKNLLAVKERLHTEVLLRTQAVMILVEVFRFASAITLFLCLFTQSSMQLLHSLCMTVSQFFSLVFSLTQCVHFSKVVLYLECQYHIARRDYYTRKQ